MKPILWNTPKSGYATNFTVTACEPLCRWAFTMEKRQHVRDLGGDL